MFPIAPHFYPICLAWSWTFMCINSKGDPQKDVGEVVRGIFVVHNVFPSSSQCVPHYVPNSTTLLSHMSLAWSWTFTCVKSKEDLKGMKVKWLGFFLLSPMCSHQVPNVFLTMFPIAPHLYPICLAWSWTFICIESKGDPHEDVGERVRGIFYVHNVFPSSSQCVPQHVPNSTTLLSHMSLAWSWTFICVKSKGDLKGMKVKWLGFFLFVPNLFPSSSQCVPQDVLNSITLLSHMFCPKLNFFFGGTNFCHLPKKKKKISQSSLGRFSQIYL